MIQLSLRAKRGNLSGLPSTQRSACWAPRNDGEGSPNTSIFRLMGAVMTRGFSLARGWGQAPVAHDMRTEKVETYE